MTCLKTPEQAAEFLQCSPKQVHAHAKSGELRYVDIGRGSKRPRRRFTDADLIDFAERRSRRETPTCQSTSLKARPYYHFGFKMRGSRFFGSTRCSDRRQAEAVERSEREKAKALSKCDRDLPHTYGEAAARFWNEVGQHNATADDTRRNLVWLGEAIGERTDPCGYNRRSRRQDHRQTPRGEIQEWRQACIQRDRQPHRHRTSQTITCAGFRVGREVPPPHRVEEVSSARAARACTRACRRRGPSHRSGHAR
jgi:hypothetical protein